MKSKKITNSKELVKLQRAMTEIGIFEKDFQQMDKGSEVLEDWAERISKAALTIIETLPKL